MQRNTDLSNVLFPVEVRPIYLKDLLKKGGQPELFQDLGNGQASQKLPAQYSQISRFRALVDTQRSHVFSVVSDGYKLISNQEAIDLGKECFKTVFSKATADGMEVFNIISPKNRSFCHIDYIHQNGGFEPWKGDKWVPFLRVTNSYNRMYPLRFNLGFCRWICVNGIIFGKKSITFRYRHTHAEVGQLPTFETHFGELKKLELEFIERFRNLKRFHVPKNEILPLTCRAFDLKVSEDVLKQKVRVEQLTMFRKQIESLTAKYFVEMGENAYAALNVLTDFASRPVSYISPAAVIDRLQRRSGEWVDDFIEKIKHDSFTFDEYLADFRYTAKIINSLN